MLAIKNFSMHIIVTNTIDTYVVRMGSTMHVILLSHSLKILDQASNIHLHPFPDVNYDLVLQ